MPWTVLLFAAGSLAIPAPSILLVPPHPSSQEDPIHIACVAPAGFLGANFTLYRGGQVVQLLQAPADQLGVTFNLSGGRMEAPGGTFRCQFGVLGEHTQPQLSDLSEPVRVSFPVPTWILALSLSLAGTLFLLTGLVTIVLLVRRENEPRRRSNDPGRLLRLWRDICQLRAPEKAHFHVLLARAPRIQHLPGMPVRLRIGAPCLCTFHSAPLS
ncbi:protein HIDE1 isoform X3 [Suricata suricatta]|uniref:Chromosome 19 open reading frame 38 n=1 Tax=Suricata suricatta TaxID=37032 RepID=A0A673VAM6_SURSU|nr:protein HIDE1 isoform X3 [Suricata suricatta]